MASADGTASDCAGWTVIGPHVMASGMIALIVERDGARRALFYDRSIGGLVYLTFAGRIRPPSV